MRLTDTQKISPSNGFIIVVIVITRISEFPDLISCNAPSNLVEVHSSFPVGAVSQVGTQ